MRKVIIFVLLVFFCLQAVAQQAVIDSLLQKLEISSNTETVDIYNQLTRACIFVSISNSLKYNELARQTAAEINYESGFAKAMYYRAKLYTYQNQFDLAKTAYLETITLYESMNDQITAARISSDLGMIYYSTGDYSTALQYVEAAYKKLLEFEDKKQLSEVTNHLGLVNWRLGNLSIALEKYFESLEYTPKPNPNTLNNISIIYGIMENNELALKYQKETLDLRIASNDKHGELNSYNNLGLIYQNMGKPRMALTYLHKSIKLAKDIGKLGEVGKALNNIGSTYENQLNMPDSALYYYQESLKFSQSYQNNYDYLNTMINIGSLQGKTGKLQKGLLTLQSIHNQVKELKSKDIKMNYLLILSQIEAASENYEKAYDYHLKHSTYKDSIFDQQLQERVAELEVKHNLKEHELQNEAYQLQLVKQERNNLRLVLLLTALIFVIVAFYIYYRAKVKMNKMLQQEISIRQKIENDLENRVINRTEKLAEINHELQDKIDQQEVMQKELEEYKISLERQVAERTKDLMAANEMLERSNRDLEKANKELLEANKLFTGREFRIKELREKIVLLEKQLRK